MERDRQWQRLRRGIQRCRSCPLHHHRTHAALHHHRTHAVPGEGSARARLLPLGEAPGAREDETGLPFQGRAGEFLDELLAGIGLARAEVFLSSSVKCRPPGNRVPRDGELATCRERWLDGQIELVDPRIVVLLGRTAARQVLGERRKLAGLHGRSRACGGREYFVTYHPASGMRFPRIRRAMRRDLARLADRLR